MSILFCWVCTGAIKVVKRSCWEGRGELKETAVIFIGKAGELDMLRREKRGIFSLLHLLLTCLAFMSVNQEALMEITIQMYTSKG